MMYASIPIPGFEKSFRIARSFSSGFNSKGFFRTSGEGFAATPLQPLTVRNGLFVDFLWAGVLSFLSKGAENERRWTQRALAFEMGARVVG